MKRTSIASLWFIFSITTGVSCQAGEIISLADGKAPQDATSQSPCDGDLMKPNHFLGWIMYAPNNSEVFVGIRGEEIQTMALADMEPSHQVEIRTCLEASRNVAIVNIEHTTVIQKRDVRYGHVTHGTIDVPVFKLIVTQVHCVEAAPGVHERWKKLVSE